MSWGRRLGALLRRRGGELLYALSDAPLGLAGLLYVVLVFGLSLVLLPVFVGLPVLAAGVAGARGLAVAERARARALLAVRLGVPASAPSGGMWARLGDRAGWRMMAYLVVRVPLALVTTALGVGVYGLAGIGVSYPLWFRHSPMVFGSSMVDTVPRVAVVFGIGVVLLVFGPLLLAAPLALSRVTVAGLLGPSPVDGRVRALEQARGQVVDSAAAELRRIERDLHDGTQARLVTLALDLSRARKMLSTMDSPRTGELRTIVEAAHTNATQAVVELRGLVGRIHPPVLDAGLEPALRSVVDSLALPVAVRVELARRPPMAIETIVYFCATELLANVVKHSGASAAAVDVTGDSHRVRLTVTDNGVGGARVEGGSGLSGLAARVSTVDGTVSIDSPADGPTVVTVDVPAAI